MHSEPLVLDFQMFIPDTPAMCFCCSGQEGNSVDQCFQLCQVVPVDVIEHAVLLLHSVAALVLASSVCAKARIQITKRKRVNLPFLVLYYLSCTVKFTEKVAINA